MKKLIVCKRFKRRWRSDRNAQISLHRRSNRARDGKGRKWSRGEGKEGMWAEVGVNEKIGNYTKIICNLLKKLYKCEIIMLLYK